MGAALIPERLALPHPPPAPLAEVILNPTPLAGYGSLVDAWSIGVVLYSCLTNQTPFDESESTPLPQRMRQRRVDATVLVECGVSEVACDFLLRLLVPDPTKRMSCGALSLSLSLSPRLSRRSIAVR